MVERVEVVDVTAEIIGERTEQWRDGFDTGMREGVRRVVGTQDSRKEPTQGQSAFAQIALELQVQRVVNDAMAAAAHQRETELAVWKAEARWYMEERDRIHAEYCAFVKAMAARFPK
ncbi:MAG: hypothetical protein ACTS5G_03420 [Burkholderiales bacterium]